MSEPLSDKRLLSIRKRAEGTAHFYNTAALLDEIKALRAENERLNTEVAELRGRLDEWPDSPLE